MCWLRDTLAGMSKAGPPLAPFTLGATEPLGPGTDLCPLPACGSGHLTFFGGPSLRLVDSAWTFLVHRLEPIPLSTLGRHLQLCLGTAFGMSTQHVPLYPLCNIVCLQGSEPVFIMYLWSMAPARHV